MSETYTVRVGQFGHPAHALHLALSFLTLGWWVAVYALHALLWSRRRDTVTITVPAGCRVEWRGGYPEVLGPDEWLEPVATPERLRLLRPYLVPGVVALVVVAVLVIR